jgi:hypothetical protein
VLGHHTALAVRAGEAADEAMVAFAISEGRLNWGTIPSLRGDTMKTSIVCVAAFMLFMALHPAHAQRCPAGADAFGSCLPLDHRYGGVSSIQQLHPRKPRPEDFKCKPWHPPETCAVVRSIGETHRARR